MTQPAKPNVVYSADWGSKEEKRCCAIATLGADGRYTAFAPEHVGNLGTLIEELRTEAGEAGCAFAGFDFPIGIPAFYAKRAGVASFRALLPNLRHGEWKDFYSVCDEPGQISVHRPFYPNGAYKGRRKEDLFRGHAVSLLEALLRRCERGGNGHKEACCLFWTLGGNQVGKAAIAGWRDVLAPALRNRGTVSLWPLDGPLPSLLVPGSIVVAETYPAECYGWFSEEPLGVVDIFIARRTTVDGLAQEVRQRKVRVLAAPWVCQVLGDEFAEAQTLVQFPHQNQAGVRGHARSLKIDIQGSIERELKGLVLCLPHSVCPSKASS